ncbi:hypothetical protein K4W89_18720 [Pseudomonas aeruginosa]|uniref:hypothetical protein n=1 Tax=Pseudomonas aeruginosa TaxID=287 RepID=UPI0008593705|nr:hypothetical protein [Pseudomonas aeruginosa]MCD2773164.1 hypothetical protein [Pseudomonas aeruginosa]OES58704.1 hypothetical protein A7R78_20720 [Pseudomonas aeruginosa]
MSIDWSKAPEGTTHYHIAEDINPWRKIEGTVAYEHYSGKWLRVNSFNEGCMPGYYVPIPQETWDGQGLPPVGTVCEYRHMIWPEYRPCEIRYISEESLVAYDDAQEQFYRTCDMLFRPLPTPEQIAAEEREKAVGDMAMSIQGVPYQYPTLYALFDAGYRRQEEGK